MKNYTFLHNPRCSKSRQSLEIVESMATELGFSFTTRLYLEEPLTKGELRELTQKLKINPLSLIRKKETIIKEENIDLSTDDNALCAMANFPKLMERPILLSSESAVIGRPPENIAAFIKENH